MTNEEAIEICKTALYAFGLMHQDFCSADELIRHLMEQKDIKVMLNALEKQVPKKPISHIKRNGTWFSCPNCRQRVTSWEEVHTGTKVYKDDCPYCDACGQAIDWSKKDG